MASDAGTPGLPQVTLTYSYDPNGNRTSMSDSLGGVVSYTYDLANQLTNLALGGTVASPQQVAFAYDPAGNMTGLTREYNQSGTWVAAATSSYTYDAANQTTGIVDKNSGGTTLVSYGYTYDLAGRVTQESRAWASGASTDTLTYGYTNNNQLTSVSHTNAAFANESFSYDANGNQTGTGYTTAAGNEQTASPGYTYTYDANGNMITSTQTSTGDVWTYGYDFRNQMTSAVEKSSTGTILSQATFTYDALDNRIGTDENGVQTWTLYDGSSPIMDFSGSGSLETRYLNGPAGQLVDTVLARESTAGAIAWYLPDRLGTVRDLVSNAGAIVDHVDFSAFGTVLGETNPSVGDRMTGFAGLVRDSLTGLNLAVMRAENPGTGRWTSQDPLSFAAGDANLYVYAHNISTGRADPTGLIDWSKWPSWLPRNTPVEQIDKMLKGQGGSLVPKKLAELKTAKKILEQAKRLAQKNSGRFRGRGGNLRSAPWTLTCPHKIPPSVTGRLKKSLQHECDRYFWGVVVPKALDSPFQVR